MITDAQVRRLMKHQSEDTLSLAAAKAGMDEKTARKYRQAGRLPSQLRVCVFRSKVATRFGLKWPPNSEQSGHLFRSESGRFLAAAETGGRHVPK